jgi:hypothetical protein
MILKSKKEKKRLKLVEKELCMKSSTELYLIIILAISLKKSYFAHVVEN